MLVRELHLELRIGFWFGGLANLGCSFYVMITKSTIWFDNQIVGRGASGIRLEVLIRSSIGSSQPIPLGAGRLHDSRVGDQIYLAHSNPLPPTAEELGQPTYSLPRNWLAPVILLRKLVWKFTGKLLISYSSSCWCYWYWCWRWWELLAPWDNIHGWLAKWGSKRAYFAIPWD